MLSGMTRVALVASAQTTELHTDGPLLIAAFDSLHIDADVVSWGRGVDWSAFDAVLVRNTWDYIFDRDAFLDWAAEVSATTRLANSVDVLRWNTDKRYLRDLEASGIPTVPTLWVDPGAETPAVEWDDFVVKPSVSAGARLSARYRGGDDPRDHIGRIHAHGVTAMLQPYLATVDAAGESGTYVFGGAVSHAIRKGAILEQGKPAVDDLDAASHQSVGPADVDPELAAFALRVLDAAPEVLYARVDTAPTHEGPVLLELEVTEPFLFLEHAPGAALRFAESVRDWLGLG
jgi:hypothetical protein